MPCRVLTRYYNAAEFHYRGLVKIAACELHTYSWNWTNPRPECHCVYDSPIGSPIIFYYSSALCYSDFQFQAPDSTKCTDFCRCDQKACHCFLTPYAQSHMLGDTARFTDAYGDYQSATCAKRIYPSNTRSTHNWCTCVFGRPGVTTTTTTSVTTTVSLLRKIKTFASTKT